MFNRGFAGEAPPKVMDVVNTWATEDQAIIEEVKEVRTNGEVS